MYRIGLMASIILTCAAAPSYQTVDYYVLHQPEHSAALQWCRNNEGLARKIPTCVNADAAQSGATIRHLSAWLATQPQGNPALDAKVCNNLRKSGASSDTLAWNKC